MDLGGVASMDGLVVGASSEGGSLLSCSLTASNTEAACARAKGCGFQRLGSARAAADPDDCDWRSLKMARTDATAVAAAPFLPGPAHHSLFPDGEQMLSFSSPPSKQESALMLGCDGSPLPYYCAPPASSPTPSYLRHAGMYTASSDMNMSGVLARVRGPFTPSQWLELEHQALIYKHIVAKVPIPPNLLIPTSRSFTSSGFPPFSSGSFGSSPMGWGSFYLGYSGNTDPEPGRCRRTDGKKWRCSRDAVADQKYCERHMNRGRHRSRKHVEGHSGHAAKAMPAAITSSSSQSATAVSGGGSSGSLRAAQSQTKSAQSNVDGASHAPFNMMMVSKQNANDQGQDSGSISMLTDMNAKPMNALFSASKQQNADFRLVSADPHLNPANSSFSVNNFMPSLKFEVLQPQSHPLHHFIDAWPKAQSDHSSVTWPEIEDVQLDRTQLSMSIPMASSEFSSSSSPNHENLTLSPLKLSREYDHAHIDSRLCMLKEVNQRQASWIPISWEASMAGPLGEALTNTSSTTKDQSKICSSSSLNLLTDGWDSSPRMESSPTGVLQKTSFGSLTSSTGSSPRAENKKTHESTGSLSDDLLGPTVVGISSM